MRRLLIALGTVLLLLGLAAVVGWWVVSRIDWSEYREPIARAGADATGRRLDLRGDLDLEIGLEPGVSIAGIALENAAWGSRPEMATVERFVVRLELLPLLFGDVVVTRIELVGLDLLLETNAEGVANWEFTPRAAEGAQKPSPQNAREEPRATATTVETRTSSAAKTPARTPIVRRAEIERATVVFRNGRAGTEQRISIDRGVALTEGERDPVTVDLTLRYGDAPIRLTGTLDGVPDVIAGGSLGLDLAIETGGAKIDVDGRVGEPLAERQLDLVVLVAGERLRAMDALLGGDLPNVGPYRVALKVTGSGDAYAIRDLDLRVGSSTLSGSVDLDLAGVKPRISAHLHSPHIALSDFAEPVAANPDPAAKSAAPRAPAGTLAPAGTPALAGTPARAGTPAPAGTPARAEVSHGTRLFSADPLPLEALGSADATLHLQAQELELGTLLFTNFALDLTLESRNLQVKQLAGETAGGHVEVSLGLDASKPVPPLAIAAKARGVELGQLLESRGVSGLTRGPLDLEVNLEGEGVSVREIMSSQNGSVMLDLGTAPLDDETAALVLGDLTAQLRRDAAPTQAQIHCAYANFAVRHGVARADGVVIDLGSIALFGEGKIDLRDEKVKLSFDRQVLSASAANILPPFTVRGTLAEPKPEVDTEALVSRALVLGEGLLGEGLLDGKSRAQNAQPASCRDLLSDYRAETEGKSSKADVVERAADAIGKKTGKKGKRVIESLKGLLGR